MGNSIGNTAIKRSSFMEDHLLTLASQVESLNVQINRLGDLHDRMFGSAPTSAGLEKEAAPVPGMAGNIGAMTANMSRRLEALDAVVSRLVGIA